MGAIEVENLHKRFAGPAWSKRRSVHEAVAGISFRVEAGEKLAYIGPNGAGKSTSIKMLTGIMRPTSGTAHVLGLIPWESRRKLAMRIGTLFGQRSQLWYQLPARHTFALLARIYRLDRTAERHRLDELGELLDARDLFDVPVRNLSLGQRMRCELVATLLHSPEVVFLDEPTIGLDLVAKTRFRDLVVRINEEHNTTILLTSHDVSDIEQVADRAIVINHGRIIYDDKVSRMRRAMLSTKIIDARLSEPVEDIAIDGATLIKLSGAGVKLEVDTVKTPIRRVLDDLLDRFEVVDISVTDPPLEAVVSHIYSQPQ